MDTIKKTIRSGPWAHINQVIYKGKDHPGKKDGKIKSEIGIDIGSPYDARPVHSIVKRLGKIPYCAKVKKE
jgi:hypothetical protein